MVAEEPERDTRARERNLRGNARHAAVAAAAAAAADPVPELDEVREDEPEFVTPAEMDWMQSETAARERKARALDVEMMDEARACSEVCDHQGWPDYDPSQYQTPPAHFGAGRYDGGGSQFDGAVAPYGVPAGTGWDDDAVRVVPMLMQPERIKTGRYSPPMSPTAAVEVVELAARWDRYSPSSTPTARRYPFAPSTREEEFHCHEPDELSEIISAAATEYETADANHSACVRAREVARAALLAAHGAPAAERSALGMGAARAAYREADARATMRDTARQAGTGIVSTMRLDPYQSGGFGTERAARASAAAAEARAQGRNIEDGALPSSWFLPCNVRWRARQHARGRAIGHVPSQRMAVAYHANRYVASHTVAAARAPAEAAAAPAAAAAAPEAAPSAAKMP
jgi:hypothetical protein